MKNIVIFIFIIAVSLGACTRKPKYVIPEKKMEDVLYDIQIAQAIFRTTSDFSADEQKDALVEGILKKYKITQAELDSSLMWYSDNIKTYTDINDNVIKRLKAEGERLIKLKSEIDARSRNWSNYIIPPFFYLTESTPITSFSIDSAKLKDIDLPLFNIRFDVQGINSQQEVEAAVYYKYNDTIIKETTLIEKDSQYSFNKPQQPDSLLKAIYGYVRMKNKVKEILPAQILLYNISYKDSLSSNEPQKIEKMENTQSRE